MMGSGKSTVGRELARLSDRQFSDTDQLLQNRFGRPIDQVFELYGEEAFRGHETSILRGLEPAAGVLATGGGIVGREENWQEMRRLGKVIYMRVPLEVLKDRLARTKRKRPLLAYEDWESRLETLLEKRTALYEQADLIFDVQEEELEGTALKLSEAIGGMAWS